MCCMKKLYASLLLLLGTMVAVQAQTLIPVDNELILPRYAYYGGTSSSNTNRIPVAVRLKLSGLTANTTYRYLAGISSNPSLTTTQAPGPMYRINNTETAAGSITGYSAVKAINSSEINNDTMITAGASRHAKFTTDAAGEYTGWFATVPIGTAAASGQQAAGADVYFYINIGSNSTPASGIIQSFRTTSTIRLLDYSSVAGNVNGCTGLIGTSDVGSEKMVTIYDNTAGTGRPLYSTFTENNNSPGSPTGNLNEGNIWTNPVLYPAVDGVSGSWAAIIPNSLSGGVKAINFYNADGTLLTLSNGPSANISNDGVWNGVATANPAGDSTRPIVINSIQGSSLPVQLLHFQGRAVKNSVELTWTTAQEKDNKHFEILRAGTDGRFFNIGTVAATTSTAATHQYSFVDAEPLSGKNLYRLRQVDKDGKSTTYKTIVVQAAQQAQAIRIVSVSNAELVLSVTAAAQGYGAISFTDMRGSVLHSRTVQLQQGENLIRIPMNGMPKQMGIVQVIGAQAERMHLKVIL